jgi:outer membrane biosynthesis protein TonB
MKYKIRKKVIVLDILLGVFFLAGLITSIIVLKGSFFNYFTSALTDSFSYAFGFTNIYFSIPVFVGMLGLVVALLWLILSLCRCRWFSVIPSLLYGIVALFFMTIGSGFIATSINSAIGGVVPDIAVMVSAGLYLIALIFGLVFFFIEVCSKRVLKTAPVVASVTPVEESKPEEVKEEVKPEELKVEEAKEEPQEEVNEEKPQEEVPQEEVKEEKPQEEEHKKVIEAIKKEEEAAPIRKTRTISKAEIAQASERKDNRRTQTIILTNEDGASYAKALHVSRRPELNKWQVKATGSDKALKLFDTQKEAIDYAEGVARRQNISVRVHSRGGKIRKA